MDWLLPNLPAAIIPLVIGGVLVAYVAYEAAASAWAAHSSSKTAFTPIFDAIADALDTTSYGTGTPGIVTLDYAIEDARRNARAAVSREAAAQAGLLAKFYAGIDTALRGTVDSIADAIATTGDVIGYHGRVAIPRAHNRANDAWKKAGAAGAAAAALKKALDAFKQRNRELEAKQNGRINDAKHAARDAHKAADRANTAAKSATGRAHAAELKAEHALTRTKAAALAGTLAAVMVGRLGFRWWRCSAFRRVGRGLNCSHWGFLEDLLLAPIIAFTVTDACLLSDAVNRAASAAADTVMKPMVGLTDNICRSGGGTMPSAVGTGGYSGAWLPTAV